MFVSGELQRSGPSILGEGFQVSIWKEAGTRKGHLHFTVHSHSYHLPRLKPHYHQMILPWQIFEPAINIVAIFTIRAEISVMHFYTGQC
jgi:hypothetical protein